MSEGNTSMVGERMPVIAAVQRHVADRAVELGGAPRSEDVDVIWASLDTPPDTWLFSANWVDHDGVRSLTGVYVGGEIVTYPLDAIDHLIYRWRKATGQMPTAEVLAAACAFLLDAEQRRELLLSPSPDLSNAEPNNMPLQVEGPRYSEAKAELPLWFWWIDEQERYFRVEIRRDAQRRIAYNVVSRQPQANLQSPER